jgi:beta-lactamase superfamily II metal-dependent hydrolase
LGLDNLDFFVATHYDADHIGGIDEIVLGGITVDKYIDRGGYTHRTKLTKKGNITQYGEYKELVEQGQHQIINLSNSCELISLGGTKIYFLTSSGSYVESIDPCSTGKVEISNKKDNDLSIGMLLVNKNFRYFIGGDLTGGGKKTKDLESKITKSVGNLDVLKLNHHGSSSSSNASFLSALSPEAIIISVGNGGVNKAIYHLPTQEVLDRVDALKSTPTVYLTNEGEGGVSVRGVIVNGHIVVRSNGSSYWVNNHAYTAKESL